MHGEDKSEVLWLPAPEEQDYPNAASYPPVTAARTHTAFAGHQTER